MNIEPFARLQRRGVRAFAAVGIVAIILLASFAAWISATHLEFDPVNGHFQNYDAARRLTAGQWPFSDFPAYLGAAAILLPFPLFEALGGTLAASNAAGDLIAIMLLGVSFVVAMRLCRWPAALAWPWAAALSAVPWPMARGNDSAIGIRSFLPFLAALCILGLHRLAGRFGRIRVFALAGVAAGLMPTWSNDYGLPCMAAYSVSILVSLDPGRGLRIRAYLAFVVSALAAVLVATTALTGGHPKAWFTFNFGDVLGDQFWYYNPVARGKVYGLADIPHGLGEIVATTPSIILWCWWAFCRRTDPRSAALAALCGAAAGGAFLSGLAGTYELRYFMPLWRLSVITLPFVVTAAIAQAWPGVRAHIAKVRSDVVLDSILVGAAVVIGSWFLSITTDAYWKQPAEGETWVAELGGFVPGSYKPAIEEARRLRAVYDAQGLPPEQRLLSTYSTAVSAITGSVQGTPDYIIHALGEGSRSAFSKALSAPYANVETMDPEFLVWGLWNVRTSWNFYRQLFTTWQPSSSTPWSVIWSRRAVPLPPGPEIKCVAKPMLAGAWELSITGKTPDEAKWVEVTADLTTSFEAGWIPLAGSHRLLEVIEGYDGADRTSTRGMGMGGNIALVGNTWTLPLQDGQVAMPLRWKPGLLPTLTLTAWPNDRALFEVVGCKAREVVSIATTEPPRDSGFRGGRLALASSSGMPPMEEDYPARKQTTAVILKLADPLAARIALPGDRVMFPRGEQGTVLMRDFGFIQVTAPLLPIDYPVDWVDVVPQDSPVTSGP